MRHICCTLTRIRALLPPPRPGRGGGGGGPVLNSWVLSMQLERGACWCNTDKMAVQWCSVVGEHFYEAILASPHPWQSPDCIPIVGSVKSLVLNDKRFNHTKVWCTFIFIFTLENSLWLYCSPAEQPVMYTTISNLLTVLYVLPISLLCTTVKLFGINIYVYVLTVNEPKTSEFVPKSATSKEHIYI